MKSDRLLGVALLSAGLALSAAGSSHARSVPPAYGPPYVAPTVRLWTVNLATATRSFRNSQSDTLRAYRDFFTVFQQPRGARNRTAGVCLDLNKGTGEPVNNAFTTNHSVLDTELPDFVGTQEATDQTAGTLCQTLAALRMAGSGPRNWRYLTGIQYAWIGHKRNGGVSGYGDERCAIVYRSDRWQQDKTSAFYTGFRTALQTSQEDTIKANWFGSQPDSVFQPVRNRIRESGTGNDFADDTVQITWRIRPFPSDNAASSPVAGAPTFKNNGYVEADSYGGPAFDQGNGKDGKLFKPAYGPYTRIATWGIFKPLDGSFSPAPDFQILVINCQLPRKSNFRDIWVNNHEATGPIVPASGISWNGTASNCKDIFSGLTDLQRNKILEPIVEDIMCEYWARCAAATPPIKPYICIVGDMNDRVFAPGWDAPGQIRGGDIFAYATSRKSGATATRNNAILDQLFGASGSTPLLKVGAGPQEMLDPAMQKGKPLGATKDSGSKDWTLYATTNPAVSSTSKFFFGCAHPLTDGGANPLSNWPDPGFTDHWWVKQMKLKFPTLP